MGLRIFPLRKFIGDMLHLKGTGGILMLYKGYMEASLTIPDSPQYNEDPLCLVISDNKFGEGYLWK